MNDLFSVRPEANPKEALRVTVRPFNRDVPRPRESVRDLKSEICSTKPETEPTELLKVIARPLV
jgi:hypothetical protein